MSILRFIVISAIMQIVWIDNAHAYLDPGTGSMIITTILGGVTGLLVAWKLLWTRIRAAFGVRGKEEESEENRK